MTLEVLISFIYGVIQHSWEFSTVFVKYFLVIGFAYSIKDTENVLQDFMQFLDRYSRESVVAIVSVGTIAYLVSYSFTPFLTTFSSILAVSYFGYLFWKF
ncbi:MAG: hypothetical protein ABEJ56_01960 [Candidatus Nanohaloarchaea archaeon]